jgi:FMN phosphatase YigB (HAD superfamily)
MIDPYLRPNYAFNRLLAEYNKYGSLVVAFDFDDTVFDFHKKGHEYEVIIQLLRELKKINCYLICWTASENLEFVKQYLLEKEIPFDAINENPPHFKDNTAKKIYYNVLLDDRAGLIETYELLLDLYHQIKFPKDV